MEKAKELKKPNEDMCLADHKVYTVVLLADENESQCISPRIVSICGVDGKGWIFDQHSDFFDMKINQYNHCRGYRHED